MSKNAISKPSELQTATVLETRDFGLIAMARSLLEEAGLEYWTEGEALLTSMPLMSSVLFKVREQDAARAKTLLEGLE